MISAPGILRYIRRGIEITRDEGIIEAGMTLLQEITGRFRYRWLKVRQPQGYYLRMVQNSRMCLSLNDPGLSRDLIIRGIRERTETNMMRLLLCPGMKIIDIGANIGYYALIEGHAVSERGHVYAIEPEPANVELLRRNIELNGYHHIDVFQAAIGDETGMARLYISDHSNLHNLLKSRGTKSKEGRVIDVKSYRLDDFVAEHRVDASEINFIRMGIEGYEVKALANMTKILCEAEALKLFIEFHPHYIKDIGGYSFESTMEMLAGFGYWIRYANALGRKGWMLEFQNIAISDFLRDERVSKGQKIMVFLERKRV